MGEQQLLEGDYSDVLDFSPGKSVEENQRYRQCVLDELE